MTDLTLETAASLLQQLMDREPEVLTDREELALRYTLATVDRLTGRVRELAFAQVDANELRQRSRNTNDLARQVADKSDELATVRAEFDEFRDICREHCGEYDANEVRLEDQVSALMVRVAELEAERDKARDTAIRLRRVLLFQMTPEIAEWDDGFAIQLDRLPDWLTAVVPEPFGRRAATDPPTGD